jgi:signal transduction histidine kinase
MLSTTTTTEDEQKLYSGVIAESSIMLMSILNEVFDIARIEANRFKAYSVAFDLNDLIYNLFVDFKNKAEEKGLQLFLENLISESFIVYSDPDIVKRILIKLLENAIKFTKKGWVKLKYTQQKDKIIFSIEDTGIGISETLWSNLFNRFIREEVSKSRNIGGTGLDLTLCNGLVKLLNGEIWYESKGKEGSIFKFSFLSSDK